MRYCPLDQVCIRCIMFIQTKRRLAVRRFGHFQRFERLGKLKNFNRRLCRFTTETFPRLVRKWQCRSAPMSFREVGAFRPALDGVAMCKLNPGEDAP